MSEQTSRRAAYLQRVEWSITDVLAVFVAGIFGATLGALVTDAIGEPAGSVTSLAIVFGFQALAQLLVIVLLSRSKGSGAAATDVGLRILGRDWWAIGLGVGLQFAVALLVSPLRDLVGDDAPEQVVVSVVRDAGDPVSWIVVAVVVGIVAPVVEEVLFRGMLLSRLVRSMSPAWAIVVSAAAFAAIHLLDPNAILAVPGLFILGLVFGFLALSTGDLSRAVFAHAGVNLAAVLALFLVESGAV